MLRFSRNDKGEFLRIPWGCSLVEADGGGAVPRGRAAGADGRRGSAPRDMHSLLVFARKRGGWQARPAHEAISPFAFTNHLVFPAINRVSLVIARKRTIHLNRPLDEAISLRH